MNGSQIYISLTNAGVYRDNKWLIRGIDLSVRKGEIVTLIGPNGSGKTTTAKLALGLLKPDEGTSFIRKNLKIKYVPQNFSIDWTLPLNVRRFLNLTINITSKEAKEARGGEQLCCHHQEAFRGRTGKAGHRHDIRTRLRRKPRQVGVLRAHGRVDWR